MLKELCFSFLFCAVMTPLLAQTVIIVDNEDLKPVTDVAVLNESGQFIFWHVF